MRERTNRDVIDAGGGNAPDVFQINAAACLKFHSVFSQRDCFANWRSFEGPPLLEAFGEEEQREDDDQNADGDGGAQRPVIGGAEKTLHHVGDHGAGSAAQRSCVDAVANGGKSAWPACRRR